MSCALPDTRSKLGPVVTNSQKRRTASQVSEGDFREIIEHSPDGIAIHRDEKFLYINPSFLDFFKVDDAAEIIGEPVYSFVHPDEHAALRERVVQLFDGVGQIPMRETRLLRPDGSEWVAELTARRVIFEGEPAIASIARDITERKKMTAQMMQMDRMIAAGTLAAGVGHEINNPLTYVCANLDFALDQLRDQTEHRSVYEALSDARDGSRRIRKIVSQLRTFSPDRDDMRDDLSMHQVIESVLGMVSNEIRHRAKLVLELDEEARTCGSQHKLGQVILNLLINAAHAIEEGAFEENEIRVRTEARPPWSIIEISDTGAGIPEDELSRIFDPFFTTKPVGQGTGLGLYISQQIVESHGGRIEVESQPGAGTLARVLLPCSQCEAPRQPHNEPAEPGEPAEDRRGRILVIDDEPMIGRLLRRMLRDDHDITTLLSAREALERMEAGESFDLILCDLMMPEVTGIDFHQRLAECEPALADRIVFITGGAFTPRATEFVAQTSNVCLEKPLRVDELRELVSRRLRSQRS